MKIIRYGIDPDPKTVAVRMATLAAEGFTAASFGITEEQLRHHLDPCHEPELFELWKIDRIGRAPLWKFLSVNHKTATNGGRAGVPPRPNGHDEPTQPNGNEDAELFNEAGVKGPRDAPWSATISPENSEDFLALAFAAKHGEDSRYVAAWGKWLEWTDDRWRQENTLKVFDLARKICRAAATACPKPGEAKNLAKSKTVAAVEQLSRSDRRIAATKDQWDLDKFSSTQEGTQMTIDLRTGIEHEPRREDYITKVGGCALAPKGTPCPLWLSFLATIMGGDYIQRVCGYCLTGSIKEHAMFFLYGTGSNGKSVFIGVLRGVLGEYHTTAPIEAFTASSSIQHSTDMAGLMGARLVTAVETEEGRVWAESKLKAITGGDEISARFMRQDFFTFVPKFKLMIAGNHKPRLRR
jgi:phage/plasmid-associated DNA primase